MKVLHVYMNGYEVGEYRHLKNGGQEFLYSESWLDKRELAVPLSLSLPLTERRHAGVRVYNYFENLLPENKKILERMQARFGTESNRPFDLLSHIGRDCVGAIQLLTERGEQNVKKIEGITLGNEDLADDLRKYKTAPLGMTEDSDFRISLAGAQEKSAYLFHDGRWKRPVGATPTTHIFKQPIGFIEHAGMDLSESVENEWLCMKILEEYGIPVPEVNIEVFGDRKVLSVKRFDRRMSEDRKWLIRLPQEDMCQAHSISVGNKYESDGGPGISQIMKLLGSSIDPGSDRAVFMKTLFIFWVLGAIDGHGKNFSIYLKAAGRFHLTPMYDVLSAYPVTAGIHKMKMAMALHSKNVHYKWKNMQRRHWLAQAKKDFFPESDMNKIIDEVVEKTDGVIDAVSKLLPDNFPEKIFSGISEGMKNACCMTGKR